MPKTSQEPRQVQSGAKGSVKAWHSSASQAREAPHLCAGARTGHLDDDGDGQVDVVRVDEAHSEARVPRKGAVDCALPQDLRMHAQPSPGPAYEGHIW